MAASFATTLKAQWDYLFTLFQGHMNFGAGGPGTGTNTAGLLQSVASVGKSEWPEFNALPFVGVALKSWNIDSLAAGQRKLVAVFQIVAVVDVVAAGGNVINLADAYAKAMTIIDDGAGNGLMPILNAPSSFGLGATCSKIIPRQGRLDWANKPSGKGTDYVAYASIMLSTENYNTPI